MSQNSFHPMHKAYIITYAFSTMGILILSIVYSGIRSWEKSPVKKHWGNR